MFIPIGDSPNFKATPWVTYGLIAVNVLVFLATLPLTYQTAGRDNPDARAYAEVILKERGVRVWPVSEYDAVVFRFGFKPRFFSVRDILTSMFLHGGWLHLIGNMLFLWIYGDNVEYRLGRVGFLLAYLGAGGAACLGDLVLRSGSAVPSVGASGAISGVLGFYFIWFPRNRVRVWVFLFPLFAQIVELPARLVLGIFLVLDNILPLLIGGSATGVAYGAHLGGFAAAVGLALVLDRLQLHRPETPVRGVTDDVDDPVESFRSALRAVDYSSAMSRLMSMPRQLSREQLSSWEKIRLGEQLHEHGHPRAALKVFQRVLVEHPLGPGRSAAHLGAAKVLLEPLAMPTAAYQHLWAALEENPTPEEEAAVRRVIEDLRHRGGVVPRR